MFYYSGSKSDATSSAQSSLGGFISSSQVVNDIAGVFQNDDTRTQYRLIVFKMNYPTSSLKFWVEQDGFSDFDIQCSFVLPVLDPICQKLYFEQIPLPTTSPLQSDFQLYDSELNSKLVENFETGGYIGVWLKKSLKPSILQQLVLPLDCSNSEGVVAQETVTIDDFSLKVLFI